MRKPWRNVDSSRWRLILPTLGKWWRAASCRLAGYQYGGFQRGGGFSRPASFGGPRSIGIIGICGWGGMALNAAAVDKRIKAVATSTMYDMSRVMSKGYNDKTTKEERTKRWSN